ncbi:MAG: bifunctional phosphoribosylaminoimidazolecarboxamide formyltransferase/IMP cyclohydrolase [Burkholderiaceae bacterium]
MPIRRALLSVSNKSGLIPFAQALHAAAVVLISTGGTARLLAEAGLPVTTVDSLTGYPEMLDGRVKTLHPAVHGALLARRDLPEHMQALTQAAIDPIDLLVVNLYPFRETLAKPGAAYQEIIENIDIGGPAMIRAAAKNHDGVAVIIDPDDYPAVLQELEQHESSLTWPTRHRLAAKAFAHTAAYDGAIANFFHGLPATAESGIDAAANTILPPSPDQISPLPRVFSLQVQQRQELRYGENPHQQAAFYRDPFAPLGGIASYEQLQGKELSFNNLADADAAWLCAQSFTDTACVIVKHANPCGVALGDTVLAAYQRAFQTDPTSAFGGILAFNREVDLACAQAIGRQFAEVVLAPGFSQEALAFFAQKTSLRLLRIPTGPAENLASGLDIKRLTGGLLVQTPDWNRLTGNDMHCVTRKQPTEAQKKDLLFAWKVATWVKSNAIVFSKDAMTMGVGAGQMSRLDSARIAAIKAGHAGLSLQDTVVASDAFFPFRDGLDVVADAGAVAVVQPGGSVRDDEVIAAANERGIAMVFTGSRHFRH